MKTFIALLFVALTALTSFAGKVGPYVYTYGTTPVDASTTSINPPPGAVVIDTSTGTHYRKISDVGSNATYAIDNVLITTATTVVQSGTASANTAKSDEFMVISGTATELTFGFPSNANSRLSQELTIMATGTNVATLSLTGTSGQSILGTALTALTMNVPVRFIKTAASTWTRVASVVTDSGVTLTTPTITTGLNASGSASNDFSSSTGTFKTSSGANQLTGAVSVTDATTPSITTATGKTNTGFLTILGKTSGGTKITTADATAQTVTISTAAQTSGASTLTIPDQAGVSSAFVFDTLAQTLTNKTITAPVIGTIVNTGTLTLPTVTGTLATLTGTATLTNKTLSIPVISGTATTTANSLILSGTMLIFIDSGTNAHNLY